MKGLFSEDMRRVPPARMVSASEIEGRDGLRDGDVGMSWVRRRALAELPSVMPSLRDMEVAHREATSFQSLSYMPLGALGSDRL